MIPDFVSDAEFASCPSYASSVSDCVELLNF
jgi:hypothetical protein